jgi:hypothetical protein
MKMGLDLQDIQDKSTGRTAKIRKNQSRVYVGLGSSIYQLSEAK